jgi:hypothetical protein
LRNERIIKSLIVGMVTTGVVIAGGSAANAAGRGTAPDPDAGMGTATMEYNGPATGSLPAGGVTPNATAPNCIGLSVEYGSVGTVMWATVVNKCGSDQRIDIVVQNAPDSGCFTLKNGYQQRWSFAGINPKVTRIDAC